MVGWGAWKAGLIGAACLVLALPLAHAQNSSVAGSAEAARASIAEKALALESRGRPDMAIQLWQQILLSDPRKRDALAGLAKDYKLIGSDALADQTLDRLRAINPNDPNIARIESMSSSSQQSEQLRQAGELARQGRNDEAMRIYRQLYGDQPPDGDIASRLLSNSLRHRQRQTAGHRRHARAGRSQSSRSALRHRARHHAHLRPAHPRRRHSHLQAHPSDPGAQSALAPGAHLGLRQSRLRRRTARVSQVPSAGHRTRRPLSTKTRKSWRR